MSVGSWRQRDATGPGVGLLTPHATYRALFAVRPPSPGTRTGIGHRLPPPPHREPCGARMGTTQTGPGNQRLPVLSGAPFWRPSLAVSQRLRERTERTTAPPASDRRRISRSPRPTPEILCADTAPFPGVAWTHPTHGSHTPQERARPRHDLHDRNDLDRRAGVVLDGSGTPFSLDSCCDLPHSR